MNGSHIPACLHCFKLQWCSWKEMFDMEYIILIYWRAYYVSNSVKVYNPTCCGLIFFILACELCDFLFHILKIRNYKRRSLVLVLSGIKNSCFEFYASEIWIFSRVVFLLKGFKIFVLCKVTTNGNNIEFKFCTCGVLVFCKVIKYCLESLIRELVFT